MPRFQQDSFNSFIIENSVIGFFEKPVVLKSGRTSNWYVNWRTVSNDAFLLEKLAGYVIDFVSDLVESKQIDSPECIYGVPEGASKLGVLSQLFWAKQSPAFAKGSHVVAMGRGGVKQHGSPEDRYFIGMPRGRTMVLEDVTTTGGSLLSTIDQLVEAEVPVCAAVGLTNRMERRDDGRSVVEAVAQKSSGGAPVKYFHMSSALELLPQFCALKKPSSAIIESIEEEFRQVGVGTLEIAR